MYLTYIFFLPHLGLDGASPLAAANSSALQHSLSRTKPDHAVPGLPGLPTWGGSRHLVCVHSQGCNGKGRAFEAGFMDGMADDHSPALLAKSTQANRFIRCICCFHRTDFNDTIK